ncbi:hypothetical protein GF386_01335 [Candidatus Pacearchaeota archaeon]|nr:hypothetical protein [Candidatus Pacearchaeota archaeon]
MPRRDYVVRQRKPIVPPEFRDNGREPESFSQKDVRVGPLEEPDDVDYVFGGPETLYTPEDLARITSNPEGFSIQDNRLSIGVEKSPPPIRNRASDYKRGLHYADEPTDNQADSGVVNLNAPVDYSGTPHGSSREHRGVFLKPRRKALK